MGGLLIWLVGVQTSIKPAVEEFLKKEQRLDVLTNNAGVRPPRFQTFLERLYLDVTTDFPRS